MCAFDCDPWSSPKAGACRSGVQIAAEAFHRLVLEPTPLIADDRIEILDQDELPRFMQPHQFVGIGKLTLRDGSRLRVRRRAVRVGPVGTG